MTVLMVVYTVGLRLAASWICSARAAACSAWMRDASEGCHDKMRVYVIYTNIYICVCIYMCIVYSISYIVYSV